MAEAKEEAKEAPSRLRQPVAAVVNASYSDERPSKGQWYSETPPTWALTWVLGELAFYYGACCLYHRSSSPQGRRRPYY